MSDGFRDYLNLVTGITEATTVKAKSVAAELLNSGVEWGSKGHTTVSELADDLVMTGRDNREALVSLIHVEFEKMVARMGFVTEDEVAALRRRVEEVEARVAAYEVALQDTKKGSKKGSKKGAKKGSKKASKEKAS